MNREDLITINEAAKLKGVSRQAIHCAIAAGRLPVIERELTIVQKLITPEDLETFKPNPNMKRAGRKSARG